MIKPTQRALDAFDAALPDDERVERKKMFGMPAAFVNGNMFMGCFGDGVNLRVSPELREELLQVDGVDVFEPKKGAPWKAYVDVACEQWADSKELATWAQQSLEFTATMPPKKPKR